MKKARVLSIVICLVMILASLMLMNSCKKKHYHNYEAITVAPTCTEEGYTSYKCECGESYVNDRIAPAHSIVKKEGKAPTCSEAGYQDYEMCLGCSYTTYTELPKLEHSFTTEVLKNPSATEDGLQRRYCRNCGESSEEQIIALSANLPKISDILSVLIGSASYTLDAGETKLTYVSEPYDLEVGTTYQIQIDVARAELTANNGIPSGSVDIEISLIELETYEGETLNEIAKKIVVTVYLEGDTVSVSVCEDDTVVSDEAEILLTETIVNYFGGFVGLDYDAIVEIIYVIGEANDLLPAIMSMLTAIENFELPEINEEFMQNAADVFALFSNNIIIQGSDNAGYTEYKINIGAFKAFIDAVDGKDLAGTFDSMFGAGTADAIRKFIVKIPTLKIGEIADRAIIFAESYGLDVERTYFVVNYFVSRAAGVEFFIQNEINNRYDMTVAECIAELSGGSVDDATEELTEVMEALVDTALGLDIDEAFNMFVYGDPEYSVDGEVFSVIAMAREMLEYLEEDVVLTFSFDEEGALKNVVVEMFDYYFAMTVDNGATICIQTPEGDRIEQITLTVLENELAFTALLTNDQCIKFSARGTEYSAYVVVTVDYKDYLTFELRLNEETKALELLDLKLYGNQTKTHQVFDEQTGTTWYETETNYVLGLHLNIADKNGVYEILFSLIDEVTIDGTVDGWDIVFNIRPEEDEIGKLIIEHEQYYLRDELLDDYTLEFYLGEDRLVSAQLVMAGDTVDSAQLYTAYREYIYELVTDPYTGEVYEERTDEYYVFDDTYIELTSVRNGEDFKYTLNMISFYANIYDDGSFEQDVLEQAGIIFEKSVDIFGKTTYTLRLTDEEGVVGGADAFYESVENDDGALEEIYASFRAFEMIDNEESEIARLYFGMNDTGFAFDIFLGEALRDMFGNREEDTPSLPEYGVEDNFGSDDVILLPGTIVNSGDSEYDTIYIGNEVTSKGPVLDFGFNAQSINDRDEYSVRLFEANLYVYVEDKHITAVLKCEDADIGDVDLSWSDESLNFVLKLYEYHSEQEDNSDGDLVIEYVEHSVFDVIDKDYLVDLSVTNTETEQSLYFTFTYGEDVIVDLDIFEGLSLILNGYDSEWVDDENGGYYVDVFKNIAVVVIEDNTLQITASNIDVLVTYEKTETNITFTTNVDKDGEEYISGLLTFSENSDRKAIYADLIVEEYDLLDLDAALWSDGAITVNLIVNELGRYYYDDDNYEVYVEETIKALFSFAASDNSVNVSSILALGGEDVVNGNVSVFVHAPDSGMGTVVEIAYNIDKLIVGMNEYVEGVGKLVFSVITEE